MMPSYSGPPPPVAPYYPPGSMPMSEGPSGHLPSLHSTYFPPPSSNAPSAHSVVTHIGCKSDSTLIQVAP